MGFVGRLEDLAVTDIFQIIALGKRTGKLTLTRRKDQGLVVFRNGGIVFCQTNAVHETMGSILVNRNIIDEATLLAALDRQQSTEGQPLGSLLVEMGAITPEELQAVAYEQVKTVLAELLNWDSGVFQFEPVELEEVFSTAFDASEFLVEDGFRPEEVLLDVLTRSDRSHLDEREGEDQEVAPLKTLGDDQAPGDREKRPARSRGFVSLKGIMRELRNRPVTFTGELTLLLLRYTAELVNRSVLFAVRGDTLVGIGQFGLEGGNEPPDQRVRSLAIPVHAPSVLGEVVSRREPYRGRLERTLWNNELIRKLGGMVPREVIAVPIVVEGAVVAVIYGDNLPSETPIGPTEGLELLMLEAGLIIEKNQLEAQLRKIRTARR